MLKFVLPDQTMYIPKFFELVIVPLKPITKYQQELDTLEEGILPIVNGVIKGLSDTNNIKLKRVTSLVESVEPMRVLLNAIKNTEDPDLLQFIAEYNIFTELLQNLTSKNIPCVIKANIAVNNSIFTRTSQEFKSFSEAEAYIENCYLKEL